MSYVERDVQTFCEIVELKREEPTLLTTLAQIFVTFHCI
jgi:hypothetical protein